MQIIAILIGVLLLAALAYYISRPLMSTRRVAAANDIASLEVQREAVYTQIRELDMDHATGKTNDEDHQRIRAELVAQAAAILKKIDGVAQPPVVEPMPAATPVPAMSDHDLEGLIAARRKMRPAANGDHLEAMIAARRKKPAAVAQADQDVEAAIAAHRARRVPEGPALVTGEPGGRSQPVPMTAKTDQDIEAAIAARRKTPPVAAKTDQDLEALIAARRKGSPQIAKVEAGQDGRTGDAAVMPAVAAPLGDARTCPKCHNPVAADDAFCAKCGTALACPKCGKPIRPGDAFCSKCGTALQSQATS